MHRLSRIVFRKSKTIISVFLRSTAITLLGLSLFAIAAFAQTEPAPPPPAQAPPCH